MQTDAGHSSTTCEDHSAVDAKLSRNLSKFGTVTQLLQWRLRRWMSTRLALLCSVDTWSDHCLAVPAPPAGQTALQAAVQLRVTEASRWCLCNHSQELCSSWQIIDHTLSAVQDACKSGQVQSLAAY